MGNAKLRRFLHQFLIALFLFCPILGVMETQLLTTAALLSPFLVPRLQLLGGHPQEDVVLFLGVVVLVALKRRKTKRSVTVRDILNQHVHAAAYL